MEIYIPTGVGKKCEYASISSMERRLTTQEERNAYTWCGIKQKQWQKPHAIYSPHQLPSDLHPAL